MYIYVYIYEEKEKERNEFSFLAEDGEDIWFLYLFVAAAPWVRVCSVVGKCVG